MVLIGGGLYYWKVAPRGPLLAGIDSVPASIRDAQTLASVKAAIELNRHLRTRPISVASRNGVVTLRGRVASPDERERAARVAAAVPDVREVTNDLRVESDTAKGDTEPKERTLGERVDDEALAMKVRLVFSLNRPLAGSRIEVETYRRHVTLRGTVPSAALRREAVEVARETAGVESVLDELSIKNDRHENRKKPIASGRRSPKEGVPTDGFTVALIACQGCF